MRIADFAMRLRGVYDARAVRVPFRASPRAGCAHVGVMETTIPTRAARPASVARPASRGAPRDDALFLVLAAVALVVVFLGFGLEFIGGSPRPTRPLTPLVVTHAIAFAGWVVLFGVQTSLVATSRTAVHQRLGVAAAGLAVVILALGLATSIHGARTGWAPIPGVDPLIFLSISFHDLVAFAVLAGAGLYWRRRPDVHKRFMWLATATLTYPAVTRIPHVRGHTPLIFGVFAAMLLIAPVTEWVTRGRVHRVSAYGGAALFLSLPLRLIIGRTAWWHAFAAWLTR